MDMPNGAVPEVKGETSPMNPNNKNNEETMDMPNGAVPEVKGETSPMILASMPLKKENVNAWYLLVSLVAAVVFMYFVFAIALPPHRIPSVNTAKSGSKDLKLERHGGDSVHTYDPQPSRAQKQCNTMPIQDNKFQKMYEEAKAAAEKAKAEAEEAKAEAEEAKAEAEEAKAEAEEAKEEAEEAKAEAEEAKAEAEEAKEEAKEIITALSVKLDVRTGSLHNQLEDAKKELNHEKAKNDQKWEAFTAAPITMAVDSYLVYWGIDEYVYDTTKAINKFLTFYDAEIIECMNLSATNPYKPHIETAVDYKFTIFSTIATSVWIFISRWQARGAVDTPVIIGTVVS
jgi:hypothetical protein